MGSARYICPSPLASLSALLKKDLLFSTHFRETCPHENATRMTSLLTLLTVLMGEDVAGLFPGHTLHMKNANAMSALAHVQEGFFPRRRWCSRGGPFVCTQAFSHFAGDSATEEKHVMRRCATAQANFKQRIPVCIRSRTFDSGTVTSLEKETVSSTNMQQEEPSYDDSKLLKPADCSRSLLYPFRGTFDERIRRAPSYPPRRNAGRSSSNGMLPPRVQMRQGLTLWLMTYDISYLLRQFITCGVKHR